MSNQKRPLSPHLQIYKPQITSVLSITHRMTGVFLSLGVFVLSFLFISLGYGPECYNAMLECSQSIIGQLFIFAWVFAFSYHLLNGIRHLFWDAGYGYEICTVTKTGIAVVVLSIAIATIIICLGWS